MRKIQILEIEKRESKRSDRACHQDDNPRICRVNSVPTQPLTFPFNKIKSRKHLTKSKLLRDFL